MDRPLPVEPLRLILVTDGIGDPQRIVSIVRAVVAGGVRCVQLREPRWTARAMLRCCETLLPVLDQAGGWLLVNDRVDVAATGSAHGAQVGHRSLPPDLAREVLGQARVLGFSAHDEEELTLAARAGCDFALLSPVWATNSKPGAAFLGVKRAGPLTEAARLPVVWLGGVDVDRVEELATVPLRQRPAGLAVRSELMLAQDPASTAAELLARLDAALATT